MKRVLEILLHLLLFLMLVFVFNRAWALVFNRAWAEDGWIMCQPDSYVNIRESPGEAGRVVGYLELGDAIQTDKHHNGYAHVTGLSTEGGEGWVASGYIVADAPQIETVAAWVDSDGRVACRRAIGGNRRKWLRPGDTLTLYASSAEWSMTSEGFVQTKYILAER